MTVADVFRAVRARWVLFAVSCIVPVAAAFAVVSNSTPVYSSTAQLYIVPALDFVGPNEYPGILFAQQVARTYTALVTSPAVMNAVIADLHLATTSSQLSTQVSATSNNVLIDVSARAGSPAAARDIANDTSVRLAAVAEQVAGLGSKDPPVQLKVVQPAFLPPDPVSPRAKTDLTLGLVVGLVVGFAVVILREKMDPRVRTEHQAQSSTGCRVVCAVEGASAPAWLPIHQAKSELAAAESFRRLRFRLRSARAARHAQSLAVTSLERGDPGPAIATNLALALAEGGSMVTLVDADTRAGRIAHYFGLDGSLGVTSVINRQTFLESTIQRDRENLRRPASRSSRKHGGTAVVGRVG